MPRWRVLAALGHQGRLFASRRTNYDHVRLLPLHGEVPLANVELPNVVVVFVAAWYYSVPEVKSCPHLTQFPRLFA